MKKTLYKLWKSFIFKGVIVILVTTLFLIIVWQAKYFEALELKSYDLLLQFKPTISSNNRIALITITEDDIQRMGKWPMDDATLSKVLEDIEIKYHPTVIGLDLYRDVAVPPGYEN